MKNEFNRLIKELVDPFMSNVDNWLTTDGITEEILESAEFNQLIEKRATLNVVFRQAIAAKVRQNIRGKKDEKGIPLFANLSYEDEQGNVTHFYKPHTACDGDDALKLRMMWIQKTIQAKNQAVFYDRLYSEKTGKQLKLPFDADSFLDD